MPCAVFPNLRARLAALCAYRNALEVDACARLRISGALAWLILRCLAPMPVACVTMPTATSTTRSRGGGDGDA
eukprot:965522-Alexandrium_andersonii.AAC.1